MEEKKFLKLSLDSRLTWPPQILFLRADRMPRLKLLRSVSVMICGANYKVLLRLLNAMMISKLKYWCEIYVTPPDGGVSKAARSHPQRWRLHIYKRFPDITDSLSTL